MRMTPLFSAQDTHVDAWDIAIFAALASACALMFQQGGFIALLGASIGGGAGWLRPINPLRPVRSAFKSAVAGLWAGMIIGGIFATALA